MNDDLKTLHKLRKYQEQYKQLDDSKIKENVDDKRESVRKIINKERYDSEHMDLMISGFLRPTSSYLLKLSKGFYDWAIEMAKLEDINREIASIERHIKELKKELGV